MNIGSMLVVIPKKVAIDQSSCAMAKCLRPWVSSKCVHSRGVAHGTHGYDVYFLHSYILPNKKGMLALMSFVPAAESKSQAEPAGVSIVL